MCSLLIHGRGKVSFKEFVRLPWVLSLSFVRFRVVLTVCDGLERLPSSFGLWSPIHIKLFLFLLGSLALYLFLFFFLVLLDEKTETDFIDFQCPCRMQLAR